MDGYGDNLLSSEKQLLATNKSLGRGDVDHRDPEQHRKAVMDRGSASLKEPRRVPCQNLGGVVRVIGDK
jgi:hypothetical protein